MRLHAINTRTTAMHGTCVRHSYAWNTCTFLRCALLAAITLCSSLNLLSHRHNKWFVAETVLDKSHTFHKAKYRELRCYFAGYKFPQMLKFITQLRMTAITAMQLIVTTYMVRFRATFPSICSTQSGWRNLYIDFEAMKFTNTPFINRI
jgi:hypothetical protein